MTQDVVPNRAQRRRLLFRNRERGVGFTRQFSSRRARLQHGTAQKVSRKTIRNLMDALRQYEEAATAQAESETPVVEAIETFDLLGEDPSEGPDDLLEVDGALDSLSAKELIAEVKAGKFDHVLADLIEGEANGKSRISVTKALNERLASLYKT